MKLSLKKTCSINFTLINFCTGCRKNDDNSNPNNHYTIPVYSISYFVYNFNSLNETYFVADTIKFRIIGRGESMILYYGDSTNSSNFDTFTSHVYNRSGLFNLTLMKGADTQKSSTIAISDMPDPANTINLTGFKRWHGTNNLAPFYDSFAIFPLGKSRIIIKRDTLQFMGAIDTNTITRYYYGRLDDTTRNLYYYYRTNSIYTTCLYPVTTTTGQTVIDLYTP